MTRPRLDPPVERSRGRHRRGAGPADRSGARASGARSSARGATAGAHAHVLRLPDPDRGRRTAVDSVGHGEVAGPARDAEAPEPARRGGAMKDHTRIEELLTLEALGAIDATEREELRAALEEHGSMCGVRCASRGDHRAAGSLPFAIEPVDVPPELEAAVVERARATPQGVPPGGWSVPLIAAGIAAALLLGVVLGANIRGGGSSTPDELAASLAEPGSPGGAHAGRVGQRRDGDVGRRFAGLCRRDRACRRSPTGRSTRCGRSPATRRPPCLSRGRGRIDRRRHRHQRGRQPTWWRSPSRTRAARRRRRRIRS